jgi:nucleoside-diphosphate-sugar epimerase
MMKIAFLGYTSFLGKEIIKLAKLHKIECVEVGRHTNIVYNYPKVSFSDHFDFHKIVNCDAIINCLGAGIQPKNTDTVQEIFELNAFEPIRLIESLHTLGYKGKLLTFGSYFEIGNAGSTKPFDESSFINNGNSLTTAYPRSKSMLTHYIGRAFSGNSYDLIHLILPNVYGSAENNHRLFPYIKDSIVNNRKMEFTSGEQVRQFLHVSDVAKQVIFMLDIQFRGILNLGSQLLSVRDAIAIAIEVLGEKYGKQAQFEFAKIHKRDSTMSFLALDDRLAREKYNWEPKTSLQEGIIEY